MIRNRDAIQLIDQLQVLADKNDAYAKYVMDRYAAVIDGIKADAQNALDDRYNEDMDTYKAYVLAKIYNVIERAPIR